MNSGYSKMRFQLNRCVRKLANALPDTHADTHTHTNSHSSEPSLAALGSSTHWFWLGRSITGFRGGNDRLWLHGFGSESS